MQRLILLSGTSKMRKVIFSFILVLNSIMLFGEGYQGFPWFTSRDKIVAGDKKYQFEKKYEHQEIISYYGVLNDISAKFNFTLWKDQLVSGKTEFLFIHKVNLAIDRYLQLKKLLKDKYGESHTEDLFGKMRIADGWGNEDNQSIAYILQNDGNVSTSWVDGDTRIELVAKKDIVYIEYTPFGSKDTKASLDLL